MESSDQNNSQPKYWMSLEQWRNDPDFAKLVENEFMSSPLQSDDCNDGWARREFLKLMGASIALSTFGCVRRPAEKIIPYAKRPVEVVPGIPDYYASSYVDGVEGLGVLVTTREGRPIKIEGNTEHPFNEGGMSARAHAHILKLYDPDRFTEPKKNLQNDKKTNFQTIGTKWEDLDKEVSAQLKKGKVGLLTSTILSPSTRELVNDFNKAFGAKEYTFDDISYANLREGQKVSFGRDEIPDFRIDKAKLIVAVNNDFLGTWLTPVRFNKQYGRGRQPGKDMNRLVVFESLLSLTGANADDRYQIKPSQTLDLLLGLLHEVIVKRKHSRFASDAAVTKVLNGAGNVESELKLPSGTLSKLADELIKANGESLMLSGGLMTDTSDAMAIQVATNLLNAALGSEGKTIFSRSLKGGQGSTKDIQRLISDLNKGQIKTLIIHGTNPVYSLPSESGLIEALRKADMVIYTGDRNDETGRQAAILAVDHHAMENWSDMEVMEGLYSLQQPTIRPLFDTRGFQDSLMTWIKASGKAPSRVTAAKTWYDYLQNNWKNTIYAKNRHHAYGSKKFEDFWDELLQTGAFETGSQGSGRSFKASAVSMIKKSGASAKGYELALYATVGLGDSQLANVSWLQEFPDPVTKITWDNYATISPADSRKEKLYEGQIVELKVGKKSLKVPIHIQPGQATGTIGLAVGFGRDGAGKVADGVGQRAIELASWKDGELTTSALDAQMVKTGDSMELACVQGHQTMEGRQIVVEETLGQYMKKPGSTIAREKLTTMWSKHKYPGRKWGMVIDLNTCTGCSACMIACQSENNIPTVGKKNVLHGREMHWLRMDRYYIGHPDSPDTVYQPIVCMNCDNAPCETVCPVMATVHGDEGTNDMIYNRCVGTRYCSNNCPYKVRRFNWFKYTDIPSPKYLALNPEVTVRSRGVMEKCTFCIHRIRFEESQANVHNRKLKDGDVVTACQQSCPTGAIVFGDLNDPNSRVAKLFHAENAYALLAELNTRPSVHYKTKVRNVAKLEGRPKIYKEEEEGLLKKPESSKEGNNSLTDSKGQHS